MFDPRLQPVAHQGFGPQLPQKSLALTITVLAACAIALSCVEQKQTATMLPVQPQLAKPVIYHQMMPHSGVKHIWSQVPTQESRSGSYVMDLQQSGQIPRNGQVMPALEVNPVAVFSIIASAAMAALAGAIWKWRSATPSSHLTEEYAMVGSYGTNNQHPISSVPSAHQSRDSTQLWMGKGPFGWFENNKDVSGRDKMFEEQQKILELRRSGKNLDAAKSRREQVTKYMKGQLPKEEMDAIKKKNEAKAKALSKEAVKGGIPLPMASFGMPEFDGGERFDLKGPYVDEGWVDEDAKGPFDWLPWNKKKKEDDK